MEIGDGKEWEDLRGNYKVELIKFCVWLYMEVEGNGNIKNNF